MEPIYAVALSMTQGVDGPTPVAHLSYSEGDRKYMLRLQWPEMPKRQAEGDAGLWLYSVLLRLVEDFDEHTITEAKVDGVEEMKEAARG